MSRDSPSPATATGPQLHRFSDVGSGGVRRDQTRRPLDEVDGQDGAPPVLARRIRDAIEDAVAAGVLNDNEAGIMRAADEATDRVVKVDDFASDELVGGHGKMAAE